MSDTNFKVQFSIDPIDISRNDLEIFKNNLKSLITTANKSENKAGNKYYAASFRINGSEISVKSWEAQDLYRYAPKTLNNLHLYFSEHGKPISNVSLQMNHNYRAIIIEGSNQAQVESISKYVKSKLEEHSSFLNGMVTNTLLHFLIFFCIFLIINRIKSSKKILTQIIFGFFILLLLSTDIYYSTPDNNFSEGFRLYAENVNIFEKYNSFIGAISFITTLFGVPILIEWYLNKFFNKNNPK